MSQDLRHQLGKSLIQQKYEEDERPSPYASPERWKAIHEAYDSGPREIRVPVHIDPYGPLSSPEQLQQLINSSSTPECLSTTMAPDKEQLNSTDPSPRQVQICHISLSEKFALDCVAECSFNEQMVFFEGKERYVLLVRRIQCESGEIEEPTSAAEEHNEEESEEQTVN